MNNSPETDSSTSSSPHDLHHAALHDEGLSAQARYDYLSSAIIMYEDDLDKARALRDRAKYAQLVYTDAATSSKHDPSRWEKDLLRSATLLTDYNGDRSDDEIRREEAATQLISGRLYLFDGIRRGDFANIERASKMLREGLGTLAGPSDTRPDQYAVNSEPFSVIADRYAGQARVGLERIVRMFKIAASSEDPNKVRYSDPSLDKIQRRTARRRALGRCCVALAVNYAPGETPEPDNLLRKLIMRSVHNSPLPRQ